MKHDSNLKDSAISLRKTGKTYNEILAEIPVAKSTLSLWLRDVGLAKVQQQRISKKRSDAQKKGALARKEQRIKTENEIINKAKKDIGHLSKRELMLLGTALYWAEGAKAKPHSCSVGLNFANSDPKMILVYMKWLREILVISDNQIRLRIYIHKNSKNRIEDVIKFWLSVTKLKRDNLRYIYYKKHNIKTKRKNINNSYNGLLYVQVSKSTNINRKVHGWTLGIVENYVSLS